MNRFEDLFQRVTMLNAQLRPIEHHVGSEVRHLLYSKLWEIVAELNSALNLGLDNTALDLTAEGEQLRIHFWSGVGGSVEQEVNILIDRAFKVQKHVKDLGTGTVTTT